MIRKRPKPSLEIGAQTEPGSLRGERFLPCVDRPDGPQEFLIQEILEKVGPDQIDTQAIDAGTALPQELAAKLQLIESTLRGWNIPDPNARFTGELLR